MAKRLPYTIPGLDETTAAEVIEILDYSLISMIDLSLTIKHIHWNVVGRSFIAVHQMLDPQGAAVRAAVDQIAERIATLGGTPVGTPGALVERRDWEDYPLGKATVPEHLIGLDEVYTTVIEEHRQAQEKLSELDPVSEDMVIGHLADLELFQWFVRAHLEDTEGRIDR